MMTTEQNTESIEIRAEVEHGIASASVSASAITSNTVEGEGKGSNSLELLKRKLKDGSSRRVSVYANLTYVPGHKTRLFSPPRQRQKWGSDQILPHVNWGDLFFDLFYVAGFFNMGNILFEDPSPIGILYFLVCFFSLLENWSEKMRYDSQFTYGDDVFHKIFDSAVLIVLAASVSFIQEVSLMSNPTKYHSMFGFALSLTLSQLLSCFRHVECYYFGRGQRKNIASVAKASLQNKIIPLGCHVAATVVAGTAFFPKNYRKLAETSDEAADCDNSSRIHIPIILILIAYIVQQLQVIVRTVFFFPKDGKHKIFTIPMNIDFCIHRMGELTMLLLGESILSLSIVNGKDIAYHKTFYSGVITIVVLHLLHFRSQPHNANTHAMRRNKNAGILFYQTFSFYSAALVAVGASYKLLLYSIYYRSKDKNHSACDPSDEEREQMIANLFSGAMAIIFFCLDIMLLTHVGLKKELGRCTIYGAACETTGAIKMHYNFKGLVFVILPHVALTIFIATLSQWKQEPEWLAGLGLAAVVCQYINRFMGNLWFPNSHGDGHGDGRHGGIDDEFDDILSGHMIEDSAIYSGRSEP